MNLSQHFSIDEFTTSQTAARLGLDNTPPPDVVEALKRTALGLEMVRALLQAPIHINSGYRSPVVNRAVGGAANSQHMTGQAADIICPGFGTPVEVVRAIVSNSSIPYDQCILEFNSWCHISFSAMPRKQALIVDNDGTRVFA
jgi:hypothetical protein